MRRGFIVFLLLLVQFQFAWGAAASYCSHEKSAAASKHVGHHDHQHQGLDLKGLGSDAGGGTLPTFDPDCGGCHLGTPGIVPVCVSVMATLPRHDYLSDCSQQYRSHYPSGLDRPDRISHVAAA